MLETKVEGEIPSVEVETRPNQVCRIINATCTGRGDNMINLNLAEARFNNGWLGFDREWLLGQLGVEDYKDLIGKSVEFTVNEEGRIETPVRVVG